MSSREFQSSSLDHANVCCTKGMYVFSPQVLDQCDTVASIIMYFDMKDQKPKFLLSSMARFVLETFKVDDNVIQFYHCRLQMQCVESNFTANEKFNAFESSLLRSWVFVFKDKLADELCSSKKSSSYDS